MLVMCLPVVALSCAPMYLYSVICQYDNVRLDVFPRNLAALATLGVFLFLFPSFARILHAASSVLAFH